ncbi:hypothetical protein VTJ04DRAFT_5936 [Mycothermus thermophilus]|uniref:uncharacterized protein n=1 Tax=Humicola insolens TaxID=85995 RepID=UPI0037440CC9
MPDIHTRQNKKHTHAVLFPSGHPSTHPSISSSPWRISLPDPAPRRTQRGRTEKDERLRSEEAPRSGFVPIIRTVRHVALLSFPPISSSFPGLSLGLINRSIDRWTFSVGSGGSVGPETRKQIPPPPDPDPAHLAHPSIHHSQARLTTSSTHGVRKREKLRQEGKNENKDKKTTTPCINAVPIPPTPSIALPVIHVRPESVPFSMSTENQPATPIPSDVPWKKK